MFSLFIKTSVSDASFPWQMGMQDPATPVMEGIVKFHDDLMFFLVLIVTFVLWVLSRCLYFFNEKTNPQPTRFVHGTALEIVWTLIPAVVLALIASPSIALLYASSEEFIIPNLTIKIIGNQWYWTYEYSDSILQSTNFETVSPISYESYMIPDNELKLGQFRLLEVDNRVVVPVNTHVRLIITASDVLHSWAVPSLGVKVDACPGRLNQTSLFLNREGVFYGQCSEICGINHGFMPIVVEAVSLEKFEGWYLNKIEQCL